MRDATKEEQKAQTDYIMSIAKPTGLNFDTMGKDDTIRQSVRDFVNDFTSGKYYHEDLEIIYHLMNNGEYLNGPELRLIRESLIQGMMKVGKCRDDNMNVYLKGHTKNDVR